MNTIVAAVCLALLFVVTVADAQVITVSDDIYLKGQTTYQVIGKYGKTILLFRDRGGEYAIQAYNEDLQSHWDRVLDFEKQSADIVGVVPHDTSFHVIYGYRYKGDYYLKYHEYNAKVELVDSNKINVLTNNYFAPRYRSVVSEDNSKAVIIRTDRESDIKVYSFDMNTGEVLWEKEILFQGLSFRRDLREMIVNNDGDMFIIMDDEKNSRRYREFSIVAIESGSKVLRRREFDLDELFANDMRATYDNLNNKLVISGLYNEKSINKSSGIYIATLDGRTFDTDVRIIPFNSDVLEEVHGKEVSIKKGVSDFMVKDIVLRQDGGMILLAEMHREYSRRPNMPIRATDLGPSGWVDYYLEDVIVFSIHPDGSIHWNTILHKKQYSQDDNAIYSSYFVFKTPEKIRLLYNDDIKQDNTVSEYILRGNGYQKRRSVFNTDYQKLGLRFRDALQVAYNECIVPSERNNRLNLVRIKFEEGD